MHLQTPIAQLRGVGDVLAGRLKRLGIFCVEDLLYNFPFRYEDYSTSARIVAITEGSQVTIQAKIELIAARRSPRKRKIITEALVTDGTGQLRLIWFGQPYIAKVLSAGETVHFSGKITRDMLGHQMVNPSYEKITNEKFSTHTGRLVPLYPLTEGVTHKQLRYLLSQVLEIADSVSDWVPSSFLQKARLPTLAQALRGIHFPESEENLRMATARLKFDELFILQLRAEMIRQELARETAPRISFDAGPIKQFVAGLPFNLTDHQKTAAWEIFQDMERLQPMNRLLEGDVGSGKTVVAAMAAYHAIHAGFQVAIMAPTEILAHQHFETIKKIMAPYPISIAIMTGNTCYTHNPSVSNDVGEDMKSTAKKRNLLVTSLENGEVSLIIGTHALLSEQVRFHNLGLVIVDEQHRFGVEQRHILREKSGNMTAPHFLSMTATPIPRSFALTLFGDLDISLIKQMPAGRLPIKTRVVAPHNRAKAYQFIKDEVQKGRQVFVICPLIAESDESKTKNKKSSGSVEQKTVMNEFDHLSREVFPDLGVDFLHGKMKSKEKDAVMQKFAQGITQILVATSVVEVGVNIPNASVMMIEGAEAFGLAQLHQFRGRVGRSVHQSYCFLFTQTDKQKALDRLSLFEKTLDGFALAEYDLETRGPGEVYGTAQSGMMRLRLASMRDVGLITLARELARGLDFTTHTKLREKVRIWEQKIHLE